jgi:hypothetical protein
MKIPIETKPALWGAAGGAVALAIAGFGWGGWATAGKAEAMAQTRVNEAVVAVLAPVCVEKFERAENSAANRIALSKVATWSQGEFVEKGGWAAIGAGNPAERISSVARACALLLTPDSHK